LIFARRGKPGPDPHLEWRVRLFFIGAVLALVGVARESSLLVGGGIAVLLVAMVLRFFPSTSAHEEEATGSREEADPGPPERP